MNQKNGFTLIELLVSLTIISIIVSVAVLSVRTTNPDDILLEFSQDLKARMEYASERAALTMTSLGLFLQKDSYSFVFLDENNKWQMIDDSRYLKLQNLPEGYTISASFPEGEIDFSPTPSEDNKKDTNDKEENEEKKMEPIQPHLFFFADNNIEPNIILSITDKDNNIEAIIKFDENGLFEITMDDIL
jgi:general secretion pathway protein H